MQEEATDDLFALATLGQLRADAEVEDELVDWRLRPPCVVLQRRRDEGLRVEEAAEPDHVLLACLHPVVQEGRSLTQVL